MQYKDKSDKAEHQGCSWASDQGISFVWQNNSSTPCVADERWIYYPITCVEEAHRPVEHHKILLLYATTKENFVSGLPTDGVANW